jgi:hypothetical protein
VGSTEAKAALSLTSPKKPKSSSFTVGVEEALVAAEAELEELGAAEAEMFEREEVEEKELGTAASVGLAATKEAGIIVRSVNLLE